MKTQLKLLVLFITILICTFLPDIIPSFFGDWLCEGSGEIFVKEQYGGHWTKCDYANYGYHKPTWHWGYRHWLFLIFGIIMTIVNIVRIAEEPNK